MSVYPKAVDESMVSEYPALTKSGGGYFYDEVLEYRVWCRPWLGAPDEFDGEIYFYAFPTYEEAIEFSSDSDGKENPLVLVKQLEWIDEPEENIFVHEKGERITEWRVEWLKDSKRNPNSIEEFINEKNA